MAEKKQHKERRFHYAWVIFFVCTVSFVSTAGIQLSTQGLFYQPVSKSLGVSVGLFTLNGIFTGVGNMLAQSFSAKVLQKYNVRIVYGIALGLYGLLFLAMSMFTQLWMWYAANFIMGLCSGFAGIPILAYLMNRWFAKKRSTMLGLSTSISSVIVIVSTMLASSILERYGWRRLYVLFGLFIILIGAPFVAIFVRREPKDLGLLPYGASPEDIEKERTKEYEVKVRLYPGEKKLFVCLFLMILLISFPQCFTSHLASYGISIGYTQMASALLISFANGGNLVAKLVISSLNERFGAKKMTAVILILLLCSMLTLVFGTQVRALVYIGAAVCGISLMTATVQIPVVVWDMFDVKRYTPIYNMLSIGSFLTTTVGGSVVGLIYSRFDSYAPCMWLAFILLSSALVLLPIVYRLRKKIPAEEPKIQQNLP